MLNYVYNHAFIVEVTEVDAFSFYLRIDQTHVAKFTWNGALCEATVVVSHHRGLPNSGEVSSGLPLKQRSVISRLCRIYSLHYMSNSVAHDHNLWQDGSTGYSEGTIWLKP